MGIPEKWDSGPGTNDLGPMRATRDPPSRALHLGPGTAGNFTWNPGPGILHLGSRTLYKGTETQ